MPAKNPPGRSTPVLCIPTRTATINQIRAFLIEQGITVRTGADALRNSLFVILQNRSDEISPRMNDLIVGLYED